MKFALPATVFEVQPGFILGAKLTRSARKVSRVCVRELEPGLVVPACNRSNVEKPEELAEELGSVGVALGAGKGPVGLLVPDETMRVSILEFEALPAGMKDQEALIRWKMKPLLPFPVEEARISFQVTAHEANRIEVLVAAARNSVLTEYEILFKDLSGDVRLILPATAAMIPLLGHDAEQNELLVHACAGGLTVVVAEARRVRLWRRQPLNGESRDGWLAVVAQEVARTLASAQDRLGLAINRIRLCARPPIEDDLAAEIGSKIGKKIETLLVGPLSGEKISDQEAELLRSWGCTLAGLLANAA
jgi:hypothetical protein